MSSPRIIGVLLLFSLVPARADVSLHSQPPNRLFGISSDTEYIDDGGHLTGALIADRFSLAQQLPTCRVVFYAFFGGTGVADPGPPSGSETVRVKFYADAAGLPGSVLQEESFSNPSRAWTGFFIGIQPSRKEYRYQVDLPQCFNATPGVNYWVEVSQLDDPSSLMRWENSNGGEFAVQFPLDTPWRLSANPSQMAYDLRTPEPCSGALLVLSFACVVRRPAR